MPTNTTQAPKGAENATIEATVEHALAQAKESAKESKTPDSLTFGGYTFKVAGLERTLHKCASTVGRVPLAKEASKSKYSAKGLTSMHEFDWTKVPTEQVGRVKAEIAVYLAAVRLAETLAKLT